MYAIIPDIGRLCPPSPGDPDRGVGRSGASDRGASRGGASGAKTSESRTLEQLALKHDRFYSKSKVASS